MGKVVQSIRRETVDHSTGEVSHSEQTNVVRFQNEPAYVKIYLEDLGAILQLKGKQQDLLYTLVKRMNFDGEISLNVTVRKQIAEALGISDGTLRNYLVVMCERELFKRVGTNEYLANPSFFAKGAWGDIAKRRSEFAMTVTYSRGGKRSIRAGEAEPEGESHQQQDLL